MKENTQTIEIIQKAIEESVFISEPNIVTVYELENLTTTSIQLSMDRILMLGQTFDKFAVLIDLTRTKRPDAKSRRILNERFAEVVSKSTHVSFYIKGRLLRTAIRYVMFGLEGNSCTITSDLEKALRTAREALK